MSKMDLSGLDLNLLVALEVLLDERHVTNAAACLKLSQPAMSRKLTQLRKAFDDPLLVQVGREYQRTARAEALLETLKTALSEVRRTFESPVFEPATAEGVFKICTLDYAEIVLIPSLVSAVLRKAPNIQIDIVRRAIDSIQEVVDDQADLSIGVMPASAPKNLVQQPLFEDRFVCVMHSGHPIAKTHLTLERYLNFPHAIIHTGASPGGVVDDELQRLGRVRRIAKRSPNFTASLLSVGDTELLQTVPKRLAEPLLSTGNLIMKELPFYLKPIQLSQIWNLRNDLDPLHQWFRGQILLASHSLSKNKPPDQ